MPPSVAAEPACRTWNRSAAKRRGPFSRAFMALISSSSLSSSRRGRAASSAWGAPGRAAPFIGTASGAPAPWAPAACFSAWRSMPWGSWAKRAVATNRGANRVSRFIKWVLSEWAQEPKRLPAAASNASSMPHSCRKHVRNQLSNQGMSAGRFVPSPGNQEGDLSVNQSSFCLRDPFRHPILEYFQGEG